VERPLKLSTAFYAGVTIFKINAATIFYFIYINAKRGGMLSPAFAGESQYEKRFIACLALAWKILACPTRTSYTIIIHHFSPFDK
jgi:hypothetical protein